MYGKQELKSPVVPPACRQGFARLAVKHGYTLLPFASVGLEDAVAVSSLGVDVTWLVRQAEPKWDTGGDSRLRLPFLFPYNSLERQV